MQKEKVSVRNKTNSMHLVVVMLSIALAVGVVVISFVKIKALEKELNEQPVITVGLIESEIKDIGELATMEYLYTNAGKFEDPKKIFGKNIPFTTKTFISKWSGTIKAGIQINEVVVKVNDISKEIVIHMPKAQIVSHEIDSDSVETFDEKDGLFNPVRVEDVRNFDALTKKSMEETAIANGLLEKAFENAKVIIERFVNNDVVKAQGYTIRFEAIE